jgi:hypothetical protein
VLQRQVAGHLTDGLALVVDEGVVTVDICRTDPADQFASGTLEFGHPWSGVLDQGQDRLAGGGGDLEHARAGHRLAEQLPPGAGLGFGRDRQQLPLIVEDLIARAISQQLSRLLDPQYREVKRIVHTGEYAALAPSRRRAARRSHPKAARNPAEHDPRSWARARRAVLGRRGSG